MARLTPVNTDFVADLSRLGDADALTSLRRGIETALAAAPNTLADANECPLLGYYYTFNPDQFLAYFTTPGRFIRYEVVSGRSLGVTVPLDRVTRVVEEAADSELIVTVELDADATTSALEAQTEERAEGAVAAGVMRGMSRTTRTGYVLRSGDATDIIQLATFSRALRSAIGL